MKKTILTVFMMVLGLSIFAQSGVIKELSGTVELKPAGTSAFIPASMGESVRQDTIISTSFKSTALLEVGSALIVVRPLTRLTLTEIQASSGTETLNANLQAGRIRVDLNPPAGTKASMTVTSPSATASVRGTSFDMNTRGVHVYNGKVGFGGQQGLMVNVDGGSSSSVQGSGKPSNPIGSKKTQFNPPPPAGTESSNVNTPATSAPPPVFTPEPSTPDPNPPAPPPSGGTDTTTPPPPTGGGGGGGGGYTPPPTVTDGDIDINIQY